MRQGAVAVRSHLLRGFGDSRAPDGSPWAALKYARPQGGDKPLLDAGALRAGVQTKGDADGLTAGSNARQARLQQLGGVVRHPARRRAEPWVFTGAGGATVFTRSIAAYTSRHVGRPFIGFSRPALGEVLGFLQTGFAKFVGGG
jgi:phage gpG-like protein